MSKHDNLLVSYATGTGANLAKATNHKKPWRTVRALLSKPTVTGEHFKTYMSLSKDEQLRLKSTNGWISGQQCKDGWRNLRNALPRDLATFDVDYPHEFTWDLIECENHPYFSRFESIVVSTRSSNPEQRRLRIVQPMTRMVTTDEWGAICRGFSLEFDGGMEPMVQVDKVSARPAQMMFLPTISKDGEFLVKHTIGRLLDPDEILSKLLIERGDWRNYANLPLYRGEDKLRRSANKAEDPFLKPGMIGDFCRAYDIYSVIENFLTDVYEPSGELGGQGRYSYLKGSGSNGAVVYDNGKFLFSNHGTDPIADQLVNSWDLVRIHLFGSLDDEKELEKPTSQRSSTKRMQEWVKDKPSYIEELLKSKYDQAAMFEDTDIGDDSGPEYAGDSESSSGDDQPLDDDIQADIDEVVGRSSTAHENPSGRTSADRPSGKRRRNPNEKTWFGQELDVDQKGNIRSNIYNVAVIAYNDPRFYDSIRWDSFARVPRLFHDIRSKTDQVPDLQVYDKRCGDRLEQWMHVTIRAILAAPNGPGKVGYGLGSVAERDIDNGVEMAARRNSYHPIKDDIEKAEWDGVPRLDTFFINYLGVSDTLYARESARMTLLASVVRIYEPGHKFDYAPVIQGPQGIRKSTFVATLYGREYFGEITANLSDMKAVAEQIAGKWGMELPELTSLSKGEHADHKAFMSAQVDTVRFSYDRKVSVLRRQIVVWGTTNDTTYLKDPTGNRRYWPQIATVGAIDTDRLVTERSQVWAEALVVYKAMRAEQPEGDLPLTLSSAAIPEAQQLQEAARQHNLIDAYVQNIEDWINTPANLSTFARQVGLLPEKLPGVQAGTNPDITWVKRVVINPELAGLYAIGMENWPGQNHSTMIAVQKAVSQFASARGWVAENKGAPRRRFKGNPRVWYMKPDLDKPAQAMGFIFVPGPEDIGPGFTNGIFTDDDLDPPGEEYRSDIDDLV